MVKSINCTLFSLLTRTESRLLISLLKPTALILNLIDNNFSPPIAPAMLWHKTDALMTDAVTKNLKIEDKLQQPLEQHTNQCICYEKATQLKH